MSLFEDCESFAGAAGFKSCVLEDSSRLSFVHLSIPPFRTETFARLKSLNVNQSFAAVLVAAESKMTMGVSSGSILRRLRDLLNAWLVGR